MARWALGEASPVAADGAVDRSVALSPAIEHVRRLDIQGLRGVAVLLVVLFHAGAPVPGGFLGVDVFFVVSGFVIATMLTSELERTGRLRIGSFYARRVRRLLPALASMTTFVVLAGILAGPAATQRTAALTGAFTSVFSSNVYLSGLASGYFDPSASLNPLLHTWTLAVEEQFYLVFPFLLVAGWWASRGCLTTRTRAGWLVASVLGLAVGSFLLAGWLDAGLVVTDAHKGERYAFYLAPARAWEFLAGVLIALAGPFTARALPGLATRVLGWLALGAIAFAALSSPEDGALPERALLPVVATCALLALGTTTRTDASRALSDRRLVWVGDLSYSLYLWHWPLIVFAAALLPGSGWARIAAAAFALAPAWASFRFIENPIRYGPRFRGPAIARLALLCVSLPLAVCAAGLVVERALAHAPALASWRAAQSLHADVTSHCQRPIPLAQRDRAPCTWHSPHARGTIVLFGDSNAGQFTEPVVEAGNRVGYDVEVATASSCPFVGLRVSRVEFGEDVSCRVFSAGTVAALATERPNLVIVAARTDKYIDDQTVALGAPGGALTTDPSEKSDLWLTALTATLQRLNSAGVPVVLVHPIPRLPAAPDGCAVVRVLLHACGRPTARKPVEAALAHATAIERRAVRSAGRSYSLDFASRLCSSHSCATQRGSVFLYRDPEHLSVQGARTLTASFVRSITAHAAGSRMH